MIVNVANPATGLMKKYSLEDDSRLLKLKGMKTRQTIEGKTIDDELEGAVLRITGGFDKQGFSMYEGVLKDTRARLLLRKGCKNFTPTRKTDTKRKTVRGCIIDVDISALNVSLITEPTQVIAGLTDTAAAKRMGFKRASRIRSLFGLDSKVDIKPFIIRREINSKRMKTCRITRMISATRLQRKKERLEARTDARKAILAREEAFRTLNWVKVNQSSLGRRHIRDRKESTHAKRA